MKKLFTVTLLLLVFCLSAWAEADFSRAHFETLSKSKNVVPVIPVPKYERFTLDNGMVIFLAEDHELPIFEISGYILGGYMQETADIAGITPFMLGMMTTGTKSMDEKQYANYALLNGLRLGFNTKNDYIEINANSLIEDSDTLLAFIKETLTNPDFNGTYYKRIRRNTLRGLDQAMTQDNQLINMYFSKAVFADHPYSFNADINLQKKSFENMTPEKLQQYYNRTIGPEVVYLAITGDFKSAEMKKKLNAVFSDWKKANIQLRSDTMPDIKNSYGKVIIINKPDATQAKVQMGYDFYGYSFKDAIAFNMANRIYGYNSIFSTRLGQKLRVEKSLAYDVTANYNYSKIGGEYHVFTEVKPESALDAVEMIKGEMQKIRSEAPFKDDELFSVINFYNAQYPTNYTDVLSVLDDILFNAEIRKRGAEYTNSFIKQYNALKTKDIQAAFTANTYPDRFITVIIGKKELIAPLFEQKGYKVEIVEIQ